MEQHSPTQPGHLAAQSADSVRSSYDLLTTVKLPPPATNETYTWPNIDMPPRRQALADSSNMLRTPESVMRLHEHANLKRSSFNSTDQQGVKRPRSAFKPSQQAQASARDRDTPVFDANTNMQWEHTFPNRFENNLGRTEALGSSSSGARHHSKYYTQQDTPTLPRRNLMLSPSETPYERKSNYMAVQHTPTRTERPMSVPNLPVKLMNYEAAFEPEHSSASLLNMPPLPPSASSYAAAAAAAAVPASFSTLYGPHVMNPESLTVYRSRSPQYQPKPIYIPLPHEMPKVEDDGRKPTYSYAMLIGMAILRSPDRKLTLSQIYAWIKDTFEYYRNSKPTWHNSIRHNLSLNKAFEKQVRPKGDPGKGNYWTIVPGLEYQFVRPRPPKRASDGVTIGSSRESLQPHTSGATQSHSLASSQANPARLSSASSQVHLNIQPAYERTKNSTSATSGAKRDELYTIVPQPTTGHSSPNTFGQARAFQSSSHPETIHSDGTEPDEGLLEEEKDPKDTSFAQTAQSFTDRFEPASKDVTPDVQQQHTISGDTLKLPQMHTMTSSSSPRPHSMKELPSEPQMDKRESLSPSATGHEGRVGSTSSWHQNSQLSMALSSPSASAAVETNHAFLSRTSLNTSSLAGSLEAKLAGQPSNSDLKEEKNETQSGSEEAGLDVATSGSPSSAEDTNVSDEDYDKELGKNGEDGSKDSRDTRSPGLVMQNPKTPEKLSKTQNNTSATNSVMHASIFNGFYPSLMPPRSFESPYAGTLDLSPGLALAPNFSSAERDQQPRPSHQRHRKKKSSLSSFNEFLELDFRKAEISISSTDRVEPNLSGDTELHDSSNLSSTSHIAVGPIPHIGGSHMGGFLSLDMDTSPNLVMTPIRVPFDTPIRDQTHAYSPYGRNISSSFGSPMRRS